jgi:hypothetical protein
MQQYSIKTVIRIIEHHQWKDLKYPLHTIGRTII